MSSGRIDRPGEQHLGRKYGADRAAVRRSPWRVRCYRPSGCSGRGSVTFVGAVLREGRSTVAKVVTAPTRAPGSRLPLRMIGTVDATPPSIAERAPCVLEDLSADTKCRSRFGVLRDLQVAYIQKEPGSQPSTSFSAAATLPAHATAVGRVLLAFAPARTVEMTILRGLRQYTAHTITSPHRFRRALAVTRLSRAAVTPPDRPDGERAGNTRPMMGG